MLHILGSLVDGDEYHGSSTEQNLIVTWWVLLLYIVAIIDCNYGPPDPRKFSPPVVCSNSFMKSSKSDDSSASFAFR